MLWVDRYRPKTLKDVELYPELREVLTRLSKAQDLPHLLFYGPSGSGKKTRAMAMLHEIYGPSVYSVRLEHKSVQVSDSKVVDIATLSSPHHIDINPSDAGYYDRSIVMQMIREIAQTVPLHTTVNSGKSVPYKVVVLNEVDKMSRSAQHALRRTMEKYMSTCRLFLLCNSTSRLIPPLRSRCLGIRVALHSKENLKLAVQRVCEGEGRPLPSEAFLHALAMRSDGNLRRGLLMLEASAMTRVDWSGNGATIPQADWKLFLDEISHDIVAEQTPKRLHEVRLKFYDLLAQCISGETILKTLVDSLLTAVPPTLQRPLIELAAKYDHNMKLGTKSILHLEAFVAGVMKLIKQH
ncbi:replication factor C, subunit 5, putative [Leishmania panamensis]|uniref:Replication factor C, subunit 5, putative n=3 Tax=Leishmania guyanensis species complex TaxID=38579 RepID=A0A088S351_LEIPA|nr:replication factor C, subunit 5, putative [Leishmania panamensis]AIO02818.1 replication factor C, subunit 5, putative [Leishmania panamensis]CCM19934.1 replication factor C, subunit 5, putative [Leishmania guyanensis]